MGNKMNNEDQVNEQFVVKDPAGKVVYIHPAESNAKKKAEELGKGYTVGYSRTASNNESEVNEISQSTVNSYKEKATDELKQANKYSKSEYGDIAKRVAARRTKGLKMASTRIDELHSTTLRSYSDKVMARARTKYSDLISKTDVTQNDVKSYNKSVSKDINNSNKALDKAAKKTQVPSQARESVDESFPKHQDLSAIKSDSLNAFVAKNKIQMASGHGTQVKRAVAELKRREKENQVKEDLDESTKVGDIVTPKIGPHKGKPHKVIHVHADGSFNIAPHGMDARQIKYRLGAVKATKQDLQESEEYVETLDENIDEAKLIAPLRGHIYHTKSDAELKYIVKDAGEAARAQRGMSSEGKYLDQMNDASTILHYRSKGGKQIMHTNPRMVAPKPTDDSINAKQRNNKSVEEALEENILDEEKIKQNNYVKATKKSLNEQTKQSNMHTNAFYGKK